MFVLTSIFIMQCVNVYCRFFSFLEIDKRKFLIVRKSSLNVSWIVETFYSNYHKLHYVADPYYHNLGYEKKLIFSGYRKRAIGFGVLRTLVVFEVLKGKHWRGR